jgi:hypothetical protein
MGSKPIQIVVVLAILASVVGWLVVRDRAMQRAAANEAMLITESRLAYMARSVAMSWVEEGSPPASLSMIMDTEGKLAKLPALRRDGWGRDFHYTVDLEVGRASLSSRGSDGLLGGTKPEEVDWDVELLATHSLTNTGSAERIALHLTHCPSAFSETLKKDLESVSAELVEMYMRPAEPRQ